MPLPPRQPYAFASSNPSAASSSQHQLYNHYQQQQRQPPNAPRRGYTAAPGAASAVSLLPPGQRDAGSDSVVRISNRSTRPMAHIAPYFRQHSNPFNAQVRGPAHTISDKVRNMVEIDINPSPILCLGAPLHLMHKTGQPPPVAMCGIPGASSISRKCTTSLSVGLLMACMPRSTATASASDKSSR